MLEKQSLTEERAGSAPPNVRRVRTLALGPQKQTCRMEQRGITRRHRLSQQVRALPTHTETNPTAANGSSVNMKSGDHWTEVRGDILKSLSEEPEDTRPEPSTRNRKHELKSPRATIGWWSPEVAGPTGAGVGRCELPVTAHGGRGERAAGGCVSESRLDREARKTEQPGPATTSELLSLKRKACGFQRHEGGATRPGRLARGARGDTAHAAALPPTGAPTRRGPALPAGAAYLWAR